MTNQRRLLAIVAAMVLVSANALAWVWIDNRAERRHLDHETAVRQQMDQAAEEQRLAAEQREVDQLVFDLRSSIRNESAKRMLDKQRADGPESRAERIGIRALRIALTDDDVDTRRTAALYLGSLDTAARPGVVPDLIKALKDSDDEVRLTATRRLGWSRAGEAVPALANALADANRDIRYAAAEALSQIGPKAVAAAPALVSAMPDKDNEVRNLIRHALFQIGPRAVPALVPALAHEKVEVRRWVVEILGQYEAGAKEAVPALVNALMNPDSQIQVYASAALVKIGPDATPALVAALAHENPSVRKLVIGALNRDFAVEVSLALVGALADVDVEVRRAAAKTLIPEEMGGWPVYPTMGVPAKRAKALADVTPMLVKALADTDAEVRGSVAAALWQCGPKAEVVVPALTKLLTDSEVVVQEQAAKALGWVGPAAAPVLIQALADPKTRVRPAMVDALWTIGPAAKEIRPVLVKALSDTNPEVQLTAAIALAKFGATDDVVQGLAGLLNAPTYRLRHAAVGSLGQLGPAAVPALAKALTAPKEMLADVHQPDKYSDEKKGDQHGHLRFNIVRILLQLGRDAKAAVPALAQTLSDPYLGIRQDAARTLSGIGPDASAAVPALIKALDDKDMLHEVLKTFYAIGPGAKEAIPALERVRDTTKGLDQIYATSALEAIRKPE